MDNILIGLIILVFGVNVQSTLTAESETLLISKNESTNNPLFKLESSNNVKSKRELEKFDFQATPFDDPNIFNKKKMNGLIYHENDSMNFFVPSSSIKIGPSNSEILRTHDNNFDSSNSATLNYHSSLQPILKSLNFKNTINSSEDQEPLSQVHHIKTIFSNQATPPYFDSFVSQPQYITAKSDAFSSKMGYKPSIKLQLNTYPLVRQHSSNIPIYSSMTQIPLQNVMTNHNNHDQRSKSQYVPYTAQSIQELKTSEPISKTYLHLHKDTQNIDHPYANYQYSASPAVEINGKKITLPILQLQKNNQLPNYIQAVETSPIIFSTETGLQYKTSPNLGLSFDYNKPKHINANQRSNTQFHRPSYNYGSGTQILPVQSSSSTPQIPQFKGASIDQLPEREFSKIPNDYQEFKSQTQLHFDGNLNNKPNNYKENSFNNKPVEEIRTDVEIISKKKPAPPVSKDDDDDDESSEDDSKEESKEMDSYFPKDEDDEDIDDPPKYFRLSHLQGDFQPSKSFPFTEYDTKFKKQKKVPTNTNDDDDDSDDSDVSLAAKHRYVKNSNDDNIDDFDDDDDDEIESHEDVSQKKYTSYPTKKKIEIYSSSEDDDAQEETSRQNRREKILNYQPPNAKLSKPDKKRKKNYEEELDKSFKKKQNYFKHPNQYTKQVFGENRTPLRIRHSMDEIREIPGKAIRKNRHHNYRDDIDTNRPIERKTNLNKPQVIFEQSYGLKSGNRNNVRELPVQLEKESSELDSTMNIRKSPKKHHKTPPSNAPTNLRKHLITSAAGSSLSPQILWTKEGTYNRSPKVNSRSLIQMKHGFFIQE